jgi:L-ascorbate metabolism protein UlaG (beta-lactamase superfamily)
MRRFLLPLPALLLWAVPAPAAEVKIAWWGQSFFEIVTPKGTRIVTDPHMLEEYHITPKSMKADLVLMSHLHVDHTNTGTIATIKTAKVYNALKKDGLRQDWEVVDTKFKDVHVQTIGTYHDNVSGMQRGKNGIWVIDVDGLRIVHLGDLGHPLSRAQLKKLGAVDVLMVPVGGVYTLNGIDAYKVVKQIKPRRYVIPMHYGTPIYDDLLPVSYFLTEAKDDGVPIERLKPRQWLTVDAKAPAPKQFTVAVLHWTGAGAKAREEDKEKEAEK